MPEQQPKIPNTPEQSSKMQKDIVATAGKLTGKAAKGFVEGVSEGLKTLEQIGKYGIKFTGFPAEGLLNLSMFIGGYLPNVGITAMRNFLSGFYGAYKGFDVYPTEEYPQWKYTTWADIGKAITSPAPASSSSRVSDVGSTTASASQEVFQLPIKEEQPPPIITNPADFKRRFDAKMKLVEQKLPNVYNKIVNNPEIIKKLKAMYFRNMLSSGLIEIDVPKWQEFFQSAPALYLEWSEFLPLVSEETNKRWGAKIDELLGVKSQTSTGGSDNIINRFWGQIRNPPQQSNLKGEKL
jgi:hypothetical protein